MRNLVNKPIVFSRTAKKYQFDVFYKRELELWNENPMYDGLPLRIWLYHNRLVYLGKTPKELSREEIMRGFTISGILRGYTAFNTALMHNAIRDYDIHSVFDPCAGWGERMLYCHHNDIEYYGVDVNPALCKGYENMMRDFNMTKQQFINMDSSKSIFPFVCDTVITCPPYGNTEIYSEYGAENLSKTEFLKWWEKTVHNAVYVKPKYFCFQINQKWKQPMTDIVIAAGFEQIAEYVYDNNRSSHMTRKGGVNRKREYESMVVLKRV